MYSITLKLQPSKLHNITIFEKYHKHKLDSLIKSNLLNTNSWLSFDNEKKTTGRI